MLEKRLLITIKLLLYAVLCAPMVITYFTAYPFLHGRIFWIEVFTEIVLGMYLILILVNRAYAPKISKLLYAAGAFIVALIFSTIFSVDWYISFWGDWSRMTGLILYIHLFIFFIIFSSVIRTKEQALRYIIFFSAVSFLISVMGWFQRYGYNFLRGVWVRGRVGSTLDNPSFLAIFLIFGLFASLWGVVHSKRRTTKGLLIFFAIFNLLTIFITQTRGVLVGIIVGTFVFIFWHVVTGSLKWKLGMLAVVAVLVVSFIHPYTRVKIEGMPGIGRLLTTNFLGDATVRTRILTWKIGMQAFLSRPLLGWGHDAFYAAFNKFYNPEFAAYSLSETWFDRNHNLWLDLLSMSGITGFLTYFSIFITGFFVIRRLQKAGHIHRLALSIYTSLMVVYVVGNSFEFDTPSSLLAIFFIFAVINVYDLDSPDTMFARVSSIPPNHAFRGKHDNATLRPASIFAICVGVVAILWFVPIRQAIASHKIDVAGDVAKTDLARAMPLYKDFVGSSNYFGEQAALEYATHLNNLFNIHKTALRDFEEDYALALDKLKNGIKNHPYDVNYHLAFSVLANTLATVDPVYAREAETILEEVQENINPHRQQVSLLLAETKMLLDKPNEAVEILRKTQEETPMIKEITYRLAVAYFAAGLEKEGFAQLKKARFLGMSEAGGASPILVLISIKADQGEWNKVAELYEKTVLLEPKNAALYAQMATAYATIGNRQRAVEAVKRAIELDQNLKTEGERLIYELQRR